MTAFTRRQVAGIVVASLIAAGVLGACSPKRDWSRAEATELAGTTFVLTEKHADGDDEEVEPSDEPRFIEFGDQLRLADGCDEHVGAFTFDDGQLKLSEEFEVIVTECPDEEATIASGLLRAVNAGATLSTDPDNHLRVQGADGETEFIFERAE